MAALSGFDPEDLPDEDMENTPLRVWFADTPSYGVSMPVRFELQLDFGKAVIEIRDLDIAMGDSLAGAGSIGGALTACLILGTIDTVARYFLPSYGAFFFYFAVIVIVLMFPNGLFGRRASQ